MKLYRHRSVEINAYHDEVHVTLMYPNLPDSDFRHVVVNQSSVRASDGLRLHYDYDRDGFVIEQASTFSWDPSDEKYDMDWQEVAFVESWGREKEEAK